MHLVAVLPLQLFMLRRKLSHAGIVLTAQARFLACSRVRCFACFLRVELQFAVVLINMPCQVLGVLLACSDSLSLMQLSLRVHLQCVGVQLRVQRIPQLLLSAVSFPRLLSFVCNVS